MKASYIKKMLRLSVVLLAARVFPETFSAQIPAGIEGQAIRPARLRAGDSLRVRLPKDKTFIQGLEFAIQVPAQLSYSQDSVHYEILCGTETTSRSVYEGNFFGRLNYVLQIPLQEENSIADTPYADKVPAFAGADAEVVQLRLKPGLSREAEFQVEARPIYHELGSLAISARAPDGGPDPKGRYVVFVDERYVSDPSRIVLPRGRHHVSLVSEFYRNEVRSITIEQARVTRLEIQLRDIRPTLQVSAPRGARVFLDDRQLKSFSEPFYIASGRHVLRVLVLDYEAVRTFTAENGRSYNISARLDTEIAESDD